MVPCSSALGGEWVIDILKEMTHRSDCLENVVFVSKYTIRKSKSV